MITKRKIITVDPETTETITKDMGSDEKRRYFFGESVGLLVFQPWYECIPYKGHVSYMPTYDFPVRMKFVDEPFDADGFHTGKAEWRGWNLPEWIKCAQELEEEGVRAIVCGCGLTGNIQSILSAAVEIPVYTSSMLFVPMVHKGLATGKRVGVLTVGEKHLLGHNKILLDECGIDDSIPLAIAGMDESADADTWLTMTTPDYDFDLVQRAVVNTAVQLTKDYPDLGAIVLECTEMPPYADAVRYATGLPVFDAVDMVNWVYNLVRP